MQELVSVSDCTLLTQSKIYQIDGTLYRFRHKSDSISHPQFIFEPLAGQRKTAPIRFNQQKVYSRVREVPTLYRQVAAEVSKQAIQLNLFN